MVPILLERKIKLKPSSLNTVIGGKFRFIILLSIRQFKLKFPTPLQSIVTNGMTAMPDVISHILLEAMLWMNTSEWCDDFKFQSLIVSPEQEQKNSCNAGKKKKKIGRKLKVEVHVNYENLRKKVSFSFVHWNWGDFQHWYLTQHCFYFKKTLFNYHICLFKEMWQQSLR